MRLSTSTNLLFLRPNGKIYPPKQAVEKIVNAGFTTLDFNFYDWVITKDSPYMREDGDEWLYEMAEQAEALGVKYLQSHAHFYDFLSETMDMEEKQRQQRQVLRSIRGAGILGSKVVVTHPCTRYTAEGNYRSASLYGNREYFKRLLEDTQDTGVCLAIENMTDVDTVPRKKFGASPEELVELIESVADPRLGVCWDFEHGDLMGQNQPEVIRYFGRHLMATHVSDQHGFYPVYLTHRLPMTGTIQWEPIMRALYETGYTGCFSFEAHNYLNALPDCAIESALKLAYDIGTYLMGLGRNADD